MKLNGSAVTDRIDQASLVTQLQVTRAIGKIQIALTKENVTIVDMIKRITEVVEQAGYIMPVICSPEEFMEAENE